MSQLSTAAAMETAADAIRPFHVNFPKAALDDLRQRIATRNVSHAMNFVAQRFYLQTGEGS